MKYIELIEARQNNLKSVSIKIPHKACTVICGPSGSGKSSLAFDTLFAEGQRHYTQTLSNYARQYIQQLPKPLVKHIHNLPPALALEQKNSVRSSRPVVATSTELGNFLQLLFTHLGQVICPKHKETLKAYSPSAAARKVQASFKDSKGLISIPLLSSSLQESTLKKKLIKEGFSRVWWENNKKDQFPTIQELNSLKKWPKKSTCYLVLDRLAFKDLNRLTDSLRLAYQTSKKYNKILINGRAIVNSTDNKKLILSEKPCCLHCAYEFPFPLQTSVFNFNSSLGACPDCRGFGNHLELDETKIVPEPNKSIMEGAIAPFTVPSSEMELRQLKQFCKKQNINLHTPWSSLPSSDKKKIWKGQHNFIGVQGFFNYLEAKKYKIHVRVFLARYKSLRPCKTCKESRFRKEVSYVLFRKKSFPKMMSMDIGSLRSFFQTVTLTKIEQKKALEIVQKIIFILEGLHNIGLDYLQLSRLIKTLSSGEFQRLNLIHQMGLDLSQVLYVLDEPTVGLHSTDTLRLIYLLKKLQEKGNTLVIVEHDPELISQADYIVEMGPGSGRKGGKVVFSGKKETFLNQSKSSLASYLTQKVLLSPLSASKEVDLKNYKYFLEIKGCTGQNLKNVNFKVPLNRLVTVTGVSGSGKSTLVGQTLYPALARTMGKKVLKGYDYKQLKGHEYLKEVVWISPSSLEKNRRSLPVTYLKIYDQIRNLMASHIDKYSHLSVRPGVFSLNIEGGRCPNCKGLGYQEIEMVFMDPVRVPCEKCEGQKFKPEILNLKWKKKNIYQILNMTVAEALEFFISYPTIWKPLSLLKKVGLEYLALGQNLATLSGGESQRLKLAREFLSPQTQNTLYILDEPTVGLHFQEVDLLLKVLRSLVEKGNSVLLIEHNIQVIRESDYLIDIGPGAGPRGGKILTQGSPSHLILNSNGHTAKALKRSEKN